MTESKPRRTRAPDARPQQITQAAQRVFAEKGFAAARMEDIARQAGVSKGTLYLYFPTKEALFTGMLQHGLAPLRDMVLAQVPQAQANAEGALRTAMGLMLQILQRPEPRLFMRLLISEGERFPALVDHYYQNFVSRGMSAIRMILSFGVARGEFKPSAYDEFPQLIAAPFVINIIWQTLFNRIEPLDADRMIAAHIEQVIDRLKAGT